MMEVEIPRRLRTAFRLFELGRLKVLDAPSGNGVYLRSFGPGSVGLELQQRLVLEARAEGLDMRQCNLEDDDEWPVEPGGFDVFWCSNYFEHSMSPHRLLINARKYLKDGGLALIPVPVLPSFNTCRRLLERFGVWREVYAQDHINFYTEATARKTIERAGFEGIQTLVASFPSPLACRISQALKPIWFSLLFACRKVSGWNYPPKAHKTLVAGKIRFKA